jgi:hypothetical protein
MFVFLTGETRPLGGDRRIDRDIPVPERDFKPHQPCQANAGGDFGAFSGQGLAAQIVERQNRMKISTSIR